MKKMSLFLLFIFFCMGCAPGTMGVNTPEDAGSAPQNYEKTILRHLDQTLKDPYSMKDFYASKPVLASCAIGVFGQFYGWCVTVRYNARNSYGAYVGSKTYYYWFHGEMLKGGTGSPNECPIASTW